MRALAALVAVVAVSAQAAPSFDVVSAFSLLARDASLPALKDDAGTWKLEGRPGAMALVVDKKNGFISWREDADGGKSVATEFAVFRTAKKDFIAVRSVLESPKDGARAPASSLKAWRIDPATSTVAEESKALAALPWLEGFVAAEDVRYLPNISDEDLAPWVARVVKLPRVGLTAEVRYASAALERECAAKQSSAPPVLCKNVAALKYAVRQATWDRASASFKLVKPKR